MRLAFLAAGLGALGLAALMLVAVGTYRPEKTKLMQEVKTLKHPAHLEQAKRYGVSSESVCCSLWNELNAPAHAQTRRLS